MPEELNATAASVLGFLTIGPMTGWDLNDLAQVSVGHFWNMTRSQIYRELATLTDLGYVEADKAGPRNTRRHQITEAGRTALHDWMTSDLTDSIVRNSSLVRLFFADQLTAAERRRMIAQARRLSEAKLATLEETLPMAEELSPWVGATARYGIAVERAVLAWFDEAPWGAGAASRRS